jgi:small-conductance mechanosensitive channel
VPDYGPATGEIHQAVLEAFRSHDIVIPVPQREIHLIGSAV